MEDPARTTPRQVPHESPSLGGVALWIVLTAQLVVVLDFSIVNVALPDLIAGLRVSESSADWVVTAYALTFGGLLIVGGRACDLFGRRRMLLVGLTAFAVASLGGGFSPSLEVLVAARAIQGMAAALVAPAALSMLTTSFREGPDRNRVLGYYGVMASVGFVAGLVVGGALVDTVGWRAVLFVNVPLCAVMALLGGRMLPADVVDRHEQAQLDLFGGALVTAGMAGLVLAPTIGSNAGWTSLDLAACILASGGLILAFLSRQRRSPSPLLPLSLFRHRAVVVGDLLSGLIGAWNAGEVLVLSLYCQQVLGYSPLVAGLVAVPQGVGGVLRGVVGRRLLERMGLRRFLLASCMLTGASLFLLFRFPATTHYPVLGLVLIGIGIGTTSLLYGATVAGSMGITNDEQGVAGALLNATRQIGAALGVAALASLVAGNTGVGSDAGALASDLRMALAFASGLAGLGALLSLVLPDRRVGERSSLKADPGSRRRARHGVTTRGTSSLPRPPRPARGRGLPRSLPGS
ncbi:MAG: transporter [Acidimicrobiales bacterium]|nr:transporter [Acidimicrobiales bacterium]